MTAHEPHGAWLIPRRILAPVTLAPDSLEAAARAAALAAALDAELVLVGVAPVVAPPSGTDLIALARVVENQQLVDRLITERLDELRSALPVDAAARSLLTHGPVGTAIVELAREQGADLIVLPSRHETGLMRLFDDHADRYVLHHSAVAILMVPTSTGVSSDRTPLHHPGRQQRVNRHDTAP